MEGLKRIIINADDCGKSIEVNKEIEKCIKDRKISSTTIMANMPGLEGAVKLYREYKNIVSFGWHVNLTEGEPLTQSQLLLDKGYYKEIDGKVFLNGKAFWKRRISHSMYVEIIKELKEQYNVLCDNGISISHIDSHQHIHTSPGLFFFLHDFFKELHIKRCRRMRNIERNFLKRAVRNMWTIPLKLNHISTTDTFCSLLEYYNNRNGIIGKSKTIELMVHPGHPKEIYKNEYELLSNIDISCLGGTLITYRDI